jgi:hypothetical protein
MQKETFLGFVPPMMAQSAKEPFDSGDWIFEIKLDGIEPSQPSTLPASLISGRVTACRWSRNSWRFQKRLPG